MHAYNNVTWFEIDAAQCWVQPCFGACWDNDKFIFLCLLGNYLYYKQQRIHSPILCLPKGLNPNMKDMNAWDFWIIGIYISLFLYFVLLVAILATIISLKHKGKNI